MKKLLSIAALIMILASCTQTDYTKCPNAYEHKWNTSPDYNHDGWYEETCAHCSLHRQWSASAEVSNKPGIVTIYKNPETSKEEYFVRISDGGKETLTPIRVTEITKGRSN